MDGQKIYTADTEEALWSRLAKDLNADDDILEFHAVLDLDDKKVFLDIDIDPGGGFENGISTTEFLSRIKGPPGFMLAAHHKSFVDEIGKFLGMQDVVLGYEKFDKNVIIKTNDPSNAKLLFANEATRKVFESMDNFTLETIHKKPDENNSDLYLLLTIEDGITDTSLLRNIFQAFTNILNAADLV